MGIAGNIRIGETGGGGIVHKLFVKAQMEDKLCCRILIY